MFVLMGLTCLACADPSDRDAAPTTAPATLAFTTITSEKALRLHLKRPRGLLFVGEPWSVHSEAVRRRLMALLATDGVGLPTDLSVAVVQLESPTEPSWVLEVMAEHDALTINGEAMLNYAKGDGAFLWSKSGRVVDAAPRPGGLTTAALTERTLR